MYSLIFLSDIRLLQLNSVITNGMEIPNYDQKMFFGYLHSKNKLPPSKVTLWKVEEINRMEDLILTAQHKRKKYNNTWGLWNLFVFSDEKKGPLWNLSIWKAVSSYLPLVS